MLIFLPMLAGKGALLWGGEQVNISAFSAASQGPITLGGNSIYDGAPGSTAATFPEP